MAQTCSSESRIIGWREWISLPELALPWVKAKVDTGARSSTLHALDIVPFVREGRPMVRFRVHPRQRCVSEVVEVEAPVHDERVVRSSTGHEQLRVVIRTILAVGLDSWPIDLTLTNRELMGFRMLLGREAMRGHFVVDPARSYTCGLPEWDDGHGDDH